MPSSERTVNRMLLDGQRRAVLIAGPSRWTDGASIRDGIGWMLDRYGAPGTVLVIRGTEGFDARVALCWHEFLARGVNPVPELYAPDHAAHGHDARDIRNRDLLASGRVTAVLCYTISRKDIGRVILRLAHDLEVPAWRWSRSLRRPVPGGVDVHRHRRPHRPDRPDPAYDP